MLYVRMATIGSVRSWWPNPVAANNRPNTWTQGRRGEEGKRGQGQRNVNVNVHVRCVGMSETLRAR